MNPATRWNTRLCLALLGLALLGCDESDDTTENGTSGWTGSLSATINGVSVEFDDLLWMEEIEGGDAWVIGNAGTRQLQFYLQSAQPGTYRTQDMTPFIMGRYVPDTSSPDYDYSAPEGAYETLPGSFDGTILLDAFSATALSGSFSFQLADVATRQDTITVTDGVFSMTYGSTETPSLAGIWQRSLPGVLEHTIQLQANGGFNETWADLETQECDETSGSWTVDGDTVRVVIDGVPHRAAWELAGTTLTILDPEDPEEQVFVAVSELPTCEDYATPSLAGMWENTNSAFWQTTMHFAEDGSFTHTYANFQTGTCTRTEGVWASDNDSVYASIEDAVWSWAWQLGGGELLLNSSYADGTENYAPASGMPACEDYAFPEPQLFCCTFQAEIDGQLKRFDELILREEINGGDAWVIGSRGRTQFQFYVSQVAEGSYSIDSGAMGRYVPDTLIPGFDYSNPRGALETVPGTGGEIILNEATATTLNGSFSFTVYNDDMSTALTVDNGEFDLNPVLPPTTTAPTTPLQPMYTGLCGPF